MANQMYGLGREKFLTGSINWSGDDIKAVLVDTATYTVDIDVDEFLSAIPAGERVSTSVNFSAKTTTLGVADAADITFTTAVGDESEALVIYKDTGLDTTSPLIAYIDTAVGLPITPNGGDIVVVWDEGAYKIF